MCVYTYIYIYIYIHTHAYRDWGGWGWANLNEVQLGGFWTKQFIMLEFMYKMRLLTFFRTRLKSSSSLLLYIYIYISHSNFFFRCCGLVICFWVLFVEIKYSFFKWFPWCSFWLWRNLTLFLCHSFGEKNLYIYMLQFSLKAYKWKYQFPSASLVAKSDVRRWSRSCFKKQVTISMKLGLFEFD